MYRKPDWEARLAAYLESVRLLVFTWGVHDCCMFTGDAIKAMTDVDPMPEFRGKYRSAAGASRALRTIGSGDLPRTLDGKFRSVLPALAQRGDIVMHDGLLGICLGASVVCVGREGEREGLVLFDRSTWIDPRAWRVEYGI